MNRPRSWLASGTLWLLVVWGLVLLWGLIFGVGGGITTLELERVANIVTASGFVIGLAPLAISIALSIRRRLVARAARGIGPAAAAGAGGEGRQPPNAPSAPDIPWSERWEPSGKARQRGPAVSSAREPGPGFWMPAAVCLMLSLVLVNSWALHNVPTRKAIVHVDRQLGIEGRITDFFFSTVLPMGVYRVEHLGKFYEFSSFHGGESSGGKTLNYYVSKGDFIKKSAGSDTLYLNKNGVISQWRYGGR